MHRLGAKVARDLERVIDGNLLNSGPVILRWSGAALAADPNVEGAAPAIDQEETVTALIHFSGSSVLQADLQNFMVAERLDASVTFSSSVDFTGRNGLTFELPDGNRYTRPEGVSRLMNAFELILGGDTVARTVPLRRL